MKRSVFRIQLTAKAKKSLIKTTNRTGVTQVALCSKLTEWFAGQPDTIQALILDHVPEQIQGQVASMVLRKIIYDKKAA